MKLKKIIDLFQVLKEEKQSQINDIEDCSMIKVEIEGIDAAIKTLNAAADLQEEIKKITKEKDKYFNLTVEAVQIILRMDKEIKHWRERRDALDRYCSSKGF